MTNAAPYPEDVSDQKDKEKDVWLTLGAASHILGVDPDTLRRWADAGRVQMFQTPGRHRRFLRSTVEALMQGGRVASGPLSATGERPDRFADEFRRRVRVELVARESESRFGEETRRWFREHGIRLTELLVGVLDVGRHAERVALLAEAAALGREYGLEAARQGLSVGGTVEMFVFFRARFMGEIVDVGRRRSLDPLRVGLLLDRADRALDRVILALIAGHRSFGSTRGGGSV